MRKNDVELENLELKISHFLRWGVLFSGLLMLIGWGSHLQFKVDPFLRFHHYQEVSLKQQLEMALSQSEWGTLLSYFGLFFLISLPVIRVFLTAVLFFKQKEKVLGSVAVVVLVALAVSFALGGVGG